MQDCNNSIANALELLQSCTKPTRYKIKKILKCITFLLSLRTVFCSLSMTPSTPSIRVSITSIISWLMNWSGSKLATWCVLPWCVPPWCVFPWCEACGERWLFSSWPVEWLPEWWRLLPAWLELGWLSGISLVIGRSSLSGISLVIGRSSA